METKVYGPFESKKVINFLPHRYPFIFVDKIQKLEVPVNEKGKLVQLGTKVTGVKNATINEPYFTGHFPGMPITPGVVLIETIAQVASFCLYPWLDCDEDMRVQSKFEIFLLGVDGARFRKPFVPGDSLIITAEVTKQRGSFWSFRCVGTIDGQTAVEADLLATVNLS